MIMTRKSHHHHGHGHHHHHSHAHGHDHEHKNDAEPNGDDHHDQGGLSPQTDEKQKSLQPNLLKKTKKIGLYNNI